jgi:hypothetical protein
MEHKFVSDIHDAYMRTHLNIKEPWAIRKMLIVQFKQISLLADKKSEEEPPPYLTSEHTAHRRAPPTVKQTTADAEAARRSPCCGCHPKGRSRRGNMLQSSLMLQSRFSQPIPSTSDLSPSHRGQQSLTRPQSAEVRNLHRSM